MHNFNKINCINNNVGTVLIKLLNKTKNHQQINVDIYFNHNIYLNQHPFKTKTQNNLSSFLFSTSFNKQYKKDYYQILQIQQKSTSFQNIKYKYLQLSKIYHPDSIQHFQHFQQNPSQNYHYQHKFLQIQQAYQILSNPKTRKQHDTELGIQSYWERQFSFQSSKQLQNQQFQQIIKQKIDFNDIKIGSSINSYQRILNKYQKQLDSLSFFNKIKGIWPYFVSFSLFWISWQFLETLLLNYQGDYQVQVTEIKSDNKLSLIPINIR